MPPNVSRSTLPILMVAVLAGTGLAGPSRADPDEDPGRLLTARIEAARQRIWWNSDDIVESLELTPDQRAAMDSALEAMLRTTLAPEHHAETQHEREALRKALEQRRWNEARQASRRLEELRRQPATRQLELKIAVLSRLTDSQWATLLSKHEHLLRQAWVRLGRSRGLVSRGPRVGADAPPAPD